MLEHKLIIFDFDGVLVNTADIGYVLHEEANPTLSREYFKELSNGNFLDNMNRAIREEGYKVQEDWEDQYNKKLLQLSSHDAIDRMVRRFAPGNTLAIVSSSLERHLNDFVKKEGLDSCFADILGSDTYTDKTIKIKLLLDKHQAVAKDAIFITDTLGDVREGTAAGVACIGVTWGHHAREKLETGNPYAVVDTVPELEAAIEKFFVIQ